MIFLFDKNEKLIKVIQKKVVKTAFQNFKLTDERYISDRLTVEMDALEEGTLNEIEYMAIQSIRDSHSYHYFYVATKTTKGEITTLVGVQSGIEELGKTPVFDKRPNNRQARPVIEDLLQGTNWTAGYIDSSDLRSTTFYYISTFEALKKVCEVWNLEMQFFVEMNGNSIGARYIDFKKKIGQAVGKRVVYGHNALEIIHEIERTNICTALVGRGKGVQISSAGDSKDDKQLEANGYSRKITFKDVEWSVEKGNPVNKPKGRQYVELPVMTEKFGIKQKDGKMRPKIGFVNFDEEEDPANLLTQTYNELVNVSRPQLSLRTSSVYLTGVNIGDTIRVVRHDKHIDYDTRIYDITFNRLDNSAKDIELGDNLNQSESSMIRSIVNKAVDNFVETDFNRLAKSLPDYIASSDGFNKNWYTDQDPNVKYAGKVKINDIWYKPDPQHEGHTILLRWTGEIWEELVRTYDNQALQDKIKKDFDELNHKMEANERAQSEQVENIFQQIGETIDLANLAKATGDEALKKAQEVAKNADALSQKANTIEQKVEQQELAISQRITQQDLESKGYVNNNQLTETAAGFERQISQTKGFTEQIGGINRMKFSNVKHGSRENDARWTILPTYLDSVTDTYTFSAIVSNITGNPDNKVTVAWSHPENGQYSEGQVDVPIINGRISVTMPPPKQSARTAIMVYPRGGGWLGSGEGEVDWQFTKLELGQTATDWCLAPEEMTIATKIQEVKSTVEEHTRKFTSLESGIGDLKWSEVKQTVDSYKVAISDGGSISRALQTAELVQTEVKNLSIGGRNLILNSLRPPTVYGNHPSLRVDTGQHVDEWNADDAIRFSGQLTSKKNATFAYLNTGRPKSQTISIKGDDYAFSCFIKNAGSKAILVTTNDVAGDVTVQPGSVAKLLTKGKGDGRNALQFSFRGTEDNQSVDFYFWHPKIEVGTVPTDWTPAPEDAEGQIQAISTQVTQMAGSWAVKNLTSSGTVLNQLNLNKDGSVKIDGSLVQITGTTYIEDGVISSAKISNVDAGKITAGTLDASKVNVINLNANNITSGSLSANLIRGGVMTALNGMATIDMNNSKMEFNTGNSTKMILNTSGLHYTDSNGYLLGWLGRANRSNQGTYGTSLNLSVSPGKELALGYAAGTNGGYSPSLTIDGSTGLVSIHKGFKVGAGGERIRFSRGKNYTLITNGNGNAGISIFDDGNLHLVKYGISYEVKL